MLKVLIDRENFAIARTDSLREVDFFAAINYKGFTLVLREKEAEKMDCQEVEGRFKLITFDAKMDFSTVGFIAKISKALAEEEIPVLVFSSYFTDHLLIREEHLEKAIEVFEKLGFEVET